MSGLNIALLIIAGMSVCYIGAAIYWKSPTLTNKEWWIGVVSVIAISGDYGYYGADVKEYMLISVLMLLCIYFCCFCPRFILFRDNEAMQKEAVKYALLVAGGAILLTWGFLLL